MTNESSRLPEARWVWAGVGSRPYEDSYSATQMRDYGSECVAAERARMKAAIEAFPHWLGPQGKRELLAALFNVEGLETWA